MKCEFVSKDYLETMYAIAVDEFLLASTEDEKWSVRKDMSNLIKLATMYYGYDYADTLDKAADKLRKIIKDENK